MKSTIFLFSVASLFVVGNNFCAAQSIDLVTPDEQGTTPLHMTIQCGCFRACKSLISRGANVDTIDGNGDTVLNYAVKNGASEDFVEWLHKAGANLDTQNNLGDTPLNSVIKYGGSRYIVDYLLKAGANSEITDNKGNTPFQTANLSRDYQRVLEIFRKYGKA